MTEFTSDGVVRWSFGFWNPNHAAALFCALLPFCYAGYRRWMHWAVRCFFAVSALALLAAIALTFSRTGLIVLFFEIICILALERGKDWKILAGTALAAVLVCGLVGVLARFTPDASALNRLAIWRSGAALVAANPGGVGLGNSGLLVTAFLLPDGLVCRTLVNSHLTLLAEFGMVAGICWSVFIFYALLNGVKHPAAFSSFAGIVVSAFFSSVFDWDVLFDFSGKGGLPIWSFMLSWLLLAIFLSIGVYLCHGSFRPDRAMASFAVAVLAGGAVFLFMNPGTPRVQGGFIVKGDKNSPLVLYDDEFELKKVISLLQGEYRLPMRSSQLIAEAPPCFGETVWLFGECAAFAACYPGKRLIFVSPPDYFDFPANTQKIYIRRFTSSPVTEFTVEFY